VTVELDETAVDTSGRSSGPASRPAATLGRFRLDKILGEGGMGIVYLAHDPELQRDVALKVIRGNATEAARGRLLREARAMARFSHRNVVAVHEVGSSESRDYIAMELVVGRSLDKLRSEPSQRLLDIVLEAGRGLAAAHASGIVHRDFKPHNVLVGDDGRVAVTDFGLARTAGTERSAALSEQGSSPTRTETGAVLGTPAYMAPEQWTGGEIGPATDQFAFCVTLWELTSGARPFQGGSLEELAHEVAQGPPARDDKVPRWLLPIVRRGLAPSPRDRWPSMDALLAAISSARSRTRRIAVRGGIAALALIVTLAFVWALGRDREARAPAPAPTMATTPTQRIEKQLGLLMPLPQGTENAGETYLALAGRLLPVPVGFDTVFDGPTRAAARTALADPETAAALDRLVRATKNRESRIVGELVPYPPLTTPFDFTLPELRPFLQYALIGRARALDLVDAGQRDAALELLQAIVIFGLHLQGETMLLPNMFGTGIAAAACDDLAKLDPDATRQDRWGALAGAFRTRRLEEWKDIPITSRAVTDEQLSALERVIDSPGILRGARCEAMFQVAISHLARGGAEPSSRQREDFARWSGLEDDRVAACAKHYGRILDLSPADRALLVEAIGRDDALNR